MRDRERAAGRGSDGERVAEAKHEREEDSIVEKGGNPGSFLSFLYLFIFVSLSL